MGNFNMLPLEIMLEILSRLPTEVVLECKLVSKSWKNCTQHPSLSQMHLNHLNALDSELGNVDAGKDYRKGHSQ
ncbi:hypothetical protein C5167_014901 [Papaver somniferum]|uniref:F-box domain-containing protein n=1 Tax=Papaver somniferum TaxID=3469 RepID=A0A4Y7J8V5_PAPSO|nr:hypothetical protein C5167_014901 [Papaver somniferum]